MANEIAHGGPKSYRRQTIADAYRVVRDSYHEFALKESSKKWWELFRKEVQQAQPFGIVLDLGCGTGVFARYLARFRFSVYGIDISPEMIARAHEYCPQAEFRVQPIETASFARGIFHGVTAFFSLLHLPKAQTKKVIARCYRWLSPGGILAIALVAGEGEGICQNFMGKDVPVYLSYYQSAEVQEMLRRAGFEIVDTRELHVKTENFEETELFFLARKPSA